METLQRYLLVVATIALSSYLFYFLGVPKLATVIVTIMLAAGWLAIQILVRDEPSTLHNIFWFGALVICSVGTLNGSLSFLVMHWL